MGQLVYNEYGASEAQPCPTTASMFFDDPKCTRSDYLAWRHAAANLYELGILPLWERLLEIAKAGGKAAPNLEGLVTAYQVKFNTTPVRGSAFSPGRNATLIANVVALMLEGEQTIQALRQAFIELDAIAPPLNLPPRPATPELHSPWRAYAWPIGIGVAATAVLGLTVWAVIAARSDSNGRKGARG